VGIRRERTGIEGKEKREGAECATRREREDRAHGCGEMTERERKERGEILNEDRREIRYMEQEGQNRKRKRWGIERKNFFFELLFLCLEKHNNQELLSYIIRRSCNGDR
jgi:hypothetical protein